MKNAYSRKEKLNLKEWAESKIIFTSEDVSPMLGNFKTKYSPHYIKLFQLAERTLTFKMFAKWASQSGKSLFIVIIAAQKLDQNPANIIYAQPIKDDISKILTLKLNPTLQSIPELWKKFEDYSTQEKFRTKDAMKRVPGGAFIVTGSSVKERKSLTTPLVLMDELGEFEKGAAKEFTERTKSFSRFHPLVVGASTIVDPEDEICTNHDLCEVLIEWHFECRKCKGNFYPYSDTLKIVSKVEYAKEQGIKTDEVIAFKYTNHAIKHTHIECPHCLHKIYEKERTEMILGQECDWFIKNIDGSYKRLIIEDLTEEATFGIDMNSLGSYFAPLGTIAREYIEAQNDESLLDKFYRGWLNKFYESKLSKKVLSSDIALLENDYEEFEIPDDTLGLYMGVDSQKGYFWVTVIAIEFGLNPHLVWCGRVEDEATIESFMDRQWYYQDGTRYYAGIRRAYHDWQGYKTPQKELVTNEDTGEVVENMILDMPQKVKEFAYRMAQKYSSDSEGRERYYAVRGEQFLTNDEVFKFANTSFTVKEYLEERKLKTLVINTTSTKTTFMNTVVRNIAKCKATVDDEAYYWEDRLHYINKTLANKLSNREKIVNKDYDRQITSQKYANHKNERGKPDKYRSWKGTADDHFLDCNSYIMISIQMDDLSSRPKPQRAVNDEKTMAIAMSALTDW